MSLANGIDAYLRGRGSPMAGLGTTFVQAGRRYGVDPRLLVGIGVIESSAGKALAHPYNFANWGHHRGQQYGSFGEAINDLARGLRRGYLDDGLTTPQKIVSRYAPGSDGNDEGNWASVVSQVMKQLGAKGLVSATVAKPVQQTVASVAKQAQPVLPPAPPKLVYDPLKFAKGLGNQFLSGGGSVDLTQTLPKLQAQSWSMVVPPPTKVPKGARTPQAAAPGQPAPSGQPAVSLKGLIQPAGGKIIGTPFSGTHTLGNWESDSAIDVAMPAGTPLRAAADGVIGQQFGSLGTSGRFQGLRLHLVGKGNEWYYAHLSKFAPGLKPGMRVKKGQIIGYSGSANGVAHLHLGQRRGSPLGLYR